MMRIQSACLEQTIFFETQEDYEQYKARMEKRRTPYRIENQEPQSGGGWLVRLKSAIPTIPWGDYLA